MQTLKYPFVILQFIGLWRPVHWLPGWKTELYNSYTFFMTFLLVTITLSEIIELLTSINDSESFANNSFIPLSMIGICGKVAIILKKRDEIVDLTTVLKQDPCLPKTKEEFAIKLKFDLSARSNTLSYGALVGTSVFVQILKSIVDDIPRRTLPFSAWFPFDYHESLFDYSIAYSHQIVTFASGAAVHVTFDSLVSGLMLQICAQLNILKERFREMPQLLLDRHCCNIDMNDESHVSILYLESKLLSQQVMHHLEIFSSFAKKSNDVFGFAILLQYTISALILCVSLYEISTKKLFSTAFTTQIMYLGCMLAQIFNFCFHGCEVTFESLKLSDAVYEMDWTTFSLRTKRSLLTIMARSLKPIEFTIVRVITVNLDSFNSLLKLSYSAYNVLQQTSD